MTAARNRREPAHSPRRPHRHGCSGNSWRDAQPAGPVTRAMSVGGAATGAVMPGSVDHFGIRGPVKVRGGD